jgi:tRNA(Ile)-lysidine synthase
MRFIDRFAAGLEALAPGPGTALIAVSGGRDSVVLLDLLAKTRDRHGLDLVVVHVDHGIHPDSGLVAERVEALAGSYGLRCVAGRLGLGRDAGETRARAARYRWLREARRELGARWIMTAHHADDQRETVLMRMLRGSGPIGLAGMGARHRDILRPLLPFSRATLARYAERHSLSWWEDPSNRQPRHLRAWIRAELLPLLEARLPDLAAKVAETRRHAARDRLAWDAALHEWPGLGFRVAGRRASILWPVVQALPEALAVALIEAMIRRVGGPAGSTRVRRALAALSEATSGSVADLGKRWSVGRDFDRLMVMPPSLRAHEPPRLRAGRSAAESILIINDAAGAQDWGEWRVCWRTEPAPVRQPRDGSTAWFIPEALALRTWRPGDRLEPLGGRGRRLAARCFQDAKIPRSERSHWPMIEGQGSLAWIPGVCRSRLLLPPAGTPALRIDVKASS